MLPVVILLSDLGVLPPSAGKAAGGLTAPFLLACLIGGQVLGCAEDSEEEFDSDDPPLGAARGASGRDDRAVVRAVFGRDRCGRPARAHRATGPPAILI